MNEWYHRMTPRQRRLFILEETPWNDLTEDEQHERRQLRRLEDEAPTRRAASLQERLFWLSVALVIGLLAIAALRPS